MKNLLILGSILFLIGGCTIENEAELESKVDIKLNDVTSKNDSQVLYYILSRVPSDKSNTIREEINKMNDRNGDTSLNTSLISFGKKKTNKDQYLLIRNFTDINEADDYVDEILLNPIVQNAENMQVLSQENYKKFAIENSK